MKRKLTIFILAAGILASGAAAFAENTPTETAAVVETAAERSALKEYAYDAEVVMAKEGFIAVTAEEKNSSFMYTEDTAIYDISGNKLDDEALTEGTRVRIFSESLFETRDVKFADAIIVLTDDDRTTVDVDTYFSGGVYGDYTNAKEELALNIPDDADITDVRGNKLSKEELDGKKLMVFYSFMTMSIPAQTNPEKIVVLYGFNGNAEVSEETEEAAPELEAAAIATVTAGDFTGNTVYDSENEVILIPVRAVSEALGFEVTWDAENAVVGVGNARMQIGNRECSNGEESITLAAAPINDDGTTRVCAEFFEKALGLSVRVENDTIVIG